MTGVRKRIRPSGFKSQWVTLDKADSVSLVKKRE